MRGKNLCALQIYLLLGGFRSLCSVTRLLMYLFVHTFRNSTIGLQYLWDVNVCFGLLLKNSQNKRKPIIILLCCLIQINAALQSSWMEGQHELFIQIISSYLGWVYLTWSFSLFSEQHNLIFTKNVISYSINTLFHRKFGQQVSRTLEKVILAKRVAISPIWEVKTL